jgi:hypothetical protein
LIFRTGFGCAETTLLDPSARMKASFVSPQPGRVIFISDAWAGLVLQNTSRPSAFCGGTNSRRLPAKAMRPDVWASFRPATMMLFVVGRRVWRGTAPALDLEKPCGLEDRRTFR